MKAQIRVVILTTWTLIGICLIATILLAEKFELTKAVITNIVLIYVFASCILAGFISRMKKN